MIWPDEALSRPQQDTDKGCEGRQDRRSVGDAWWLSGFGWPSFSKGACGGGHGNGCILFTELAELGPRVLFPRSQFPSTSCLSPS